MSHPFSASALRLLPILLLAMSAPATVQAQNLVVSTPVVYPVTVYYPSTTTVYYPTTTTAYYPTTACYSPPTTCCRPVVNVVPACNSCSSGTTVHYGSTAQASGARSSTSYYTPQPDAPQPTPYKLQTTENYAPSTREFRVFESQGAFYALNVKTGELFQRIPKPGSMVDTWDKVVGSVP